MWYLLLYSWQKRKVEKLCLKNKVSISSLIKVEKKKNNIAEKPDLQGRSHSQSLVQYYGCSNLKHPRASGGSTGNPDTSLTFNGHWLFKDAPSDCPIRGHTYLAKSSNVPALFYSQIKNLELSVGWKYQIWNFFSHFIYRLRTQSIRELLTYNHSFNILPFSQI